MRLRNPCSHPIPQVVTVLSFKAAVERRAKWSSGNAGHICSARPSSLKPKMEIRYGNILYAARDGIGELRNNRRGLLREILNRIDELSSRRWSYPSRAERSRSPKDRGDVLIGRRSVCAARPQDLARYQLSRLRSVGRHPYGVRESRAHSPRVPPDPQEATSPPLRAAFSLVAS